VKSIAQVKLLPSPEQAKSLLATMQTFNAACNWLAERATQLGVYSHFGLQSACYKSIRLLFGLSAQAACLVCAKVADTYKKSKTQRDFRSLGAITYDLRVLSWNLEREHVSIWALPERLSIPFICGEQQRQSLAAPRGQSDLIYRDGSFYLHVTVKVEEAEAKWPHDLIGVDLGIANIAFDSDGNSYSGTHLNKVRHRNHALRRKLQKKGTKSAKRLLKKRRRKERLFATSINHTISKSVVALAERTGRGLALEELDGIRDRVRAKKDQRYRLHSWSFDQLGSFIVYKAKRSGVPVIFVDPAYTSQECNKCHHIEKANRRSRDLFVCKKCGHTEHADGNGAKVIRLKDLEILGSAAVMPPNAEAIGCAN